MTTITREQQKQILIDTANHVISRDNTSPYSENLRELARIALASLEAEPVAYIFKHPAGELFWSLTDESNKGQNDVMPVYAAQPVQETGVYKDMLNIIGLLEKNEWAEHCTSTVLGSLLESEITRLVSKEQQAPERERIRRKHAEWSDKTFGDVGPVGPLKHLSKEALEAAADPSDPLEWADMQFLLWDAQRRMGISDEFITRAMIEKLEINKSRQWPEPKDGEPRLHIKEQPAPVVPDEMATSDDMNLYQKSFAQGWNACRAAMINGGKS
ncbi:DUF550 domain-containing protein [Salmonella enterica subsp. enterica serovar Newport]|nr:DUF550 domain-containing protein [Salmonella enterica subsp. enterica serovar Newport]